MSLFDSLKAKTSQGVSKALSSADRALKKAELNQQVTRIRSEIDARALAFGQHVLECKEATQDAVESFLSDADVLATQIQDLTARIQELDEPTAPQEEHSLAPRCAACGAELVEGHRFCGSCGAPLGSD